MKLDEEAVGAIQGWTLYILACLLVGAVTGVLLGMILDSLVF